MRLAVVTREHWSQVETLLRARYPNTPKARRRIVAGLHRFGYWRVPTLEEAREEVGGRTHSSLHARVVAATKELPSLAALPRLTTSDELPKLEFQRAFGLRVDLVRPEDRHLSFIQLWAVVQRRKPAELLTEILGGKWILPLPDLDAEVARRQALQDEELARLHLRRERPSSGYRGPQVGFIAF